MSEDARPHPEDPRESLRKGEDRFALLVESVQDYAIFMLDPSGIVATWNIGAERIKGYKSEDIIGQHFSKFYRPEDAWKCAKELTEAADAGRVEDEGFRVRKDGSVFWASVVITALRGQGGELVGFAKVTRDLTERRNAETSRLLLAHQTVAREAAERSLFGLNRLQAALVAVAAARTPEDLARVIVQMGTETLGATFGIFIRPKDSEHLELVATHGPPLVRLDEYRTFAMNARVPPATPFKTKAAEWIETPERFAEAYPDVLPGSRSGSLAALPLTLDDVVIGVIAFRFDTWREFPADERALMETFAAHAAQAVDRADVHVREVAARRRLEALGRLAEALAGALTTNDVARIVVERGMVGVGADICTLYSLDDSTGSLTLIAERGCDPGILDRIRTIDSESDNPVYRTISTGERLFIETEREYEEFFPSLATTRVEGPRARAIFSIPLVAENKPIGLLGMGFYQPRRFSPDDRDFIETLTRHCAEALHRARRVEAEQRARMLAESLQASFGTTLRSIGDAVIATDNKGDVTLMNAVAEKLTGWREEEARGKHLSEVFHIVEERTRALVESPVEKVVESGTVVGLAKSSVLIAKDQRTEIPIDDSGAPIRRKDGGIDGVVLVFRDVTERRALESRRTFLAEAAGVLGESLDYEATLRRVAQLAVPRLADWCGVDIALDGTVGFTHLAIAHVDPAKIELARELNLKYPPDPTAATGVPNVLRTGRSELYSEIPDELLAAGCVDEEHLRIARALQLRSAMIVPLAARGRVLGAMSFVFAESGRTYTARDLEFAEDLARRCAVAIDNARLYASEQRARHAADVANRAKDEFLATVSHELRTPLNAIMGWAKMMEAGHLDEGKKTRAIETIERNAVAMAQLIEDLLDVSRIISGKMRLDVQAVDLGLIIEAAIDSVKPSADARGVSVSLRFDPVMGPLIGDPTRLQQIVWNLLSNAVKFTSKGGSVEVVVTSEDSWVEVRVNDTGQGIDPPFLPHVFDPFRQAEGGTTRARGGLGLGLAIVKQLVELHGGRVDVESEGRGRGASFIVSLPLAAITRATSRPPAGNVRKIRLDSAFERPPQLDGLRVLVVDDEEDGRELVREVLERCGSLVWTAGSAAEAVRAVERVNPDILISDIGLPQEDGYELIRRVRALPAEKGGAIPAAALTAYARAEDRRRALNAGYSMHIAKPVEPSELVAVVASLARFVRASDSEAPPTSRRRGS